CRVGAERGRRRDGTRTGDGISAVATVGSCDGDVVAEIGNTGRGKPNHQVGGTEARQIERCAGQKGDGPGRNRGRTTAEGSAAGVGEDEVRLCVASDRYRSEI